MIAGRTPAAGGDLVGKAGRLPDEVERPIPVEVPIDRGEMGEGRRLSEELEGQPVAGIVRVEEIAGEGEQLPAVVGEPAFIDRIVLLQPRPGLRRVEGGLVGRDADLAAAELAG